MCIISWGSTPHLVWILDFKTSKSFLTIISLFFLQLISFQYV